MRAGLIGAMVPGALLIAGCAAGVTDRGGHEGWSLVWADEFDDSRIDTHKWDFDRDCWGGGNEERQCYTDSPRNAFIEDGKLVIMARREEASGPAWPPHLRAAQDDPDRVAHKPFTSARLVTRGKAAWRYGKVEVRAKLPQGQGTWPAIWMLPEDGNYGGWAASGEIDILEAVNLGVACAQCPSGREDRILGTLHYGGQWPDNEHVSTEVHRPEVLEGFHTFGIVWRPGRFDWTFDGKVFASREADEWWTSASENAEAPFDRPFHLILNLAIGGKLSEERGIGGVDESGYPKWMEVDWVRVWQCDPPGGCAAP
ncbi:glycoside hydrolase family 16 protein [Sphingomicrobium lutaoense]|uniref:Beta-glucanase (GH16 family) n=1 Tax=Sphingomicrobium lutaoense TaxID=515949 RepID=A0A839Z4L7_9SPHN|nr:glycoside hydrolase family 16 protein [Sphingomicrobium lutaoense]MBB3763594.1 beta-glucanase (GH16 family) [Sphingomicrobium lutaoense]